MRCRFPPAPAPSPRLSSPAPAGAFFVSGPPGQTAAPRPWPLRSWGSASFLPRVPHLSIRKWQPALLPGQRPVALTLAATLAGRHSLALCPLGSGNCSRQGRAGRDDGEVPGSGEAAHPTPFLRLRRGRGVSRGPGQGRRVHPRGQRHTLTQ